MLHWPTIDLVPDIGRRIDGARRTRLQAVHMIAVAVRKEYVISLNLLQVNMFCQLVWPDKGIEKYVFSLS